MHPILTNILVGFGALLLGYLLGSFPTGVFIGKVFFGKDPRDYGSHNSGGTNTGRVLGKPIGLLTIIIDALKASIAVYAVWAIITFTPIHDQLIIGGYDAGVAYYHLAGLAAAFGHCYSLFLRFKGGKAVACFVGLAVTVSWLFLAIAIVSFFSTLKASKYVSLSSIIMAISLSLAAWVLAILRLSGVYAGGLFTWNFGLNDLVLPAIGLEFALVATVLAAFLIYRHRGNIARLREGTESKIGWMK